MATPPSTSTPPRELPIVGDHLALDFANTVDDPLGSARHDHVATYDDLVSWSVRVGIVDASQAASLRRRAARRPREAAAALARAHELRRALNDVFGGVAEGAADVPDRWERLRPFVAAAYAEATLTYAEAGARRWAWGSDSDFDGLVHPVAAEAAGLLVSGDLANVKRCAGCPWLFLDRSKNRSRRWCDMDDCGRAQKMARYVARRAARRQAAREAKRPGR